MNIDHKKGSATIETTLIIPLILFIFFLIIEILRCFLLYNCVSSAMYKTANFAYDYGVIYHENGIKNLTDSLKEKIGDNFGVSELINAGENAVYQSLFCECFKNYLKEDKYYNEFFQNKADFDFTGTGFYNNDELVLTCIVDYDAFFPFFDSFREEISFQKNLRIKVVTTGVYSVDSHNTSDSGSIWDLSNFERGKRIEENFGGNLPDFFPVIDYYNNGKAVSIRSINHTKNNYTNSLNLKKTMESALDELYTFSGAEYGGKKINNSDIKEKEIKFVFPEDEFSSEQKKIINEVKKEAKNKGIKITIERYEYV